MLVSRVFVVLFVLLMALCACSLVSIITVRITFSFYGDVKKCVYTSSFCAFAHFIGVMFVLFGTFDGARKF